MAWKICPLWKNLQKETELPIFTPFFSANPAFTSKTYFAGAFGVKISGKVAGEMFSFSNTTRPSAPIQIMSIGNLMSFIQKLYSPGLPKTKSMPASGEIESLSPRPLVRNASVSATNAVTRVCPIETRTVFSVCPLTGRMSFWPSNPQIIKDKNATASKNKIKFLEKMLFMINKNPALILTARVLLNQITFLVPLIA